jgi:hypothetical protein
MADVNRQFSGVGTWNEIRGAEQIEKLLARQPSPAAHDFVFHHRDVRGRPAESCEAETEEQAGEFEEGGTDTGHFSSLIDARVAWVPFRY